MARPNDTVRIRYGYGVDEDDGRHRYPLHFGSMIMRSIEKRRARRTRSRRQRGWLSKVEAPHVNNEAEEDENGEGERRGGREEGDEDDDDDCADLNGHGRGVSVTAGGKKRVLTWFRHDRAPLTAQPISRHFWINHRSDKGPRYIVAPWKSLRTFSQRTAVRI
ncbi:hypothetical protein G5I_00668 [Acromyrmex echinatior]|uniref:Uncharacterized protein n=1 Tax=Acromyrmex echinatior TaxID=103372 RepID=F4W5H1_ACREC|nr:hypothetical protein G5I_00668 [Acromyrmex echinatior]